MIDTVKPSVLVVMPTYAASTNAYTAFSLFMLGTTLIAKGIGCGAWIVSSPNIDDLRNCAFTYWYDQTELTHLLFVDSDMEFKPQLVLDMLDFDKPIIGTMYRRKREEITWVGEPLMTTAVVERGFMPVERIGMGVTLIRRDCADTMIENYPSHVLPVPFGCKHDLLAEYQLKRLFRFFDRIPNGVEDISEDYAFCKRYREAGGTIWATVGHEVGHMGLYNYKGRMWESMQEFMVMPEAAE